MWTQRLKAYPTQVSHMFLLGWIDSQCERQWALGVMFNLLKGWRQGKTLNPYIQS
jgi:hypothetical protein